MMPLVYVYALTTNRTPFDRIVCAGRTFAGNHILPDSYSILSYSLQPVHSPESHVYVHGACVYPLEPCVSVRNISQNVESL